MEKRELICIGCPLGCPVTVSMEGGQVLKVGGITKWGGRKGCYGFRENQDGCAQGEDF